MWSTQRNLSGLINSVLVSRKYELFPVLEEELNKNVDTFVNILKNSPPSAREREVVKNSIKEPISLKFLNVQKRLQASTIEEALTVSDLFTLSELSSVELLLEAEDQMQYFHGFNRGLTAILLFYDCQKVCVNSLKTILLARHGRTWVLDENLPAEIASFLDSYVKKLLDKGLVATLTNQLSGLDWQKAEENLQRANGLGGLKHRKQVQSLYDEVKTSLAECVFSLACQMPLNQADTISVINYLKNHCVLHSTNAIDNKATIHTSSLYLIMALLYCFDCSYLENKAQIEVEKITETFLKSDYIKNIYAELNKSDNTEWVNVQVKSILLMSFQMLIHLLNNYAIENDHSPISNLISNSLSGLEEDETLIDKAIELHVFNFIRNVLVSHERLHQEKYFVERIHNLITDFIYKMPEKIKELRNRNQEVSRLVEDSFANQTSMPGSGNAGGGFGSFYNYPSSSSFYNYPQGGQQGGGGFGGSHYQSQGQMFGGGAGGIKIKVTPPGANENHDFEDFLNLIGEFYAKDPLKLELSLAYWQADSELSSNHMASYQKLNQKQLSLYKFVRYFMSGDSLIGSLYIAYINMLAGLSKGDESAQHCFLLLQNNSPYYDYAGVANSSAMGVQMNGSHQSSRISLQHILYAFERYYDSFRQDFQNPHQLYMQQQTPSYTPVAGGGSSVSTGSSASSHRGITQQELQGLIAVVRLLNQIITSSEKARLALCEYQRVSSGPNEMMFNATSQSLDSGLLTTMFGLVTCPISISLKGEILNLLASFALTPQLAMNMWQLLESSQLLPTSTGANQQGGTRNDIRIELEEVESRDETYPMLAGFLRLISNMIRSTYIPDNLGIGVRPKGCLLGFQPYLQFLVNQCYLKVLYRSYKSVQEKWKLASDILQIFYSIVSKYEINADDFRAGNNMDGMDFVQINQFKSPVANSSGYRLIYDLIHDGPFVRMLFTLLNECLNHLVEYQFKNNPFIEQCSLNGLKLVSLVLDKQRLFIEQMRMANLNIENTGLEKLIVTLNPYTNKSEYFMILLRFIQFNSNATQTPLIEHAYYSLNVIYMLSNYSLFNGQLLSLFLKSCLSLSEQFELMHSFVEFLEYDEHAAGGTELSKDEALTSQLKSNLNSLDEDGGGAGGSNTSDSSISVGPNDANNSLITQSTDKSSSESASSSISQNEIRNTSRVTALKLLLFYLRLPAPNFAHLLLGFDIHKSLNHQTFLNAGTKISPLNASGSSSMMIGGNHPEILSIVPRNCLHSILQIINIFVSKDSSLINKIPITLDYCYEILFVLCSNVMFNQQLLNYLRTELDLIYTNVKKIPLIAACTATTSSSYYSIYTWIVNLVCLEFQSLIANRMKVNLRKLVQLLTENSGANLAVKSNNFQKQQQQPNQQVNSTRMPMSNMNFDNLLFLNTSRNGTIAKPMMNKTTNDIDGLSVYSFDQTQTHNQTALDVTLDADLQLADNNKTFDLVKFMSFVQGDQNVGLSLNYFDSQLVEKVIESCKCLPELFVDSSSSSSTLQLYDLGKLRSILVYEIRDSATNVISVSRASLLGEIKNILRNVYERNQFQLACFFKKRYFRAVRLLVESLVLLAPCEVFPLNQRYNFLVALIKLLFQSISQENHDDLVVELTYPISSLLFTLISNLRQVVAQIQKQQYLNESNLSSIVQLNQTASHQAQTTSMDSFNLAQLGDLFKKIVDYLLNSSLTNSQVRTHLYATVLNYLTIFDADEESVGGGSGRLKLDSSSNTVVYENFRVLTNSMNGLLKQICLDSCEGLDLITLMGMSLLNKIIDMNLNNTKWIKYISDNGYVMCIINSILNTDNQRLEECFHHAHQATLDFKKYIYIFETKCALFLAMSKSVFGSELLLKNGLVTNLAACSVFNLRIKFDRNLYSNRNSSFLVPLLHQFYQLFFPALEICISILNTMGSENLDIKSQIARFVLTQSEMFLHILTSKVSDLRMLEELKLVTNLLSKLAPFDNLKFDNMSSNNSTVEHQSVFSRIHKDLLNLICFFFVPEQLKQMRKEIEQHHQVVGMSKDHIIKLTTSYLAEIASNISTYCTSIMKIGQFNNTSTQFLIFSPKIESQQLHPYSPTAVRINSKHLQLGLLVDFIKVTLDNLEKTVELELDLNNKNEHINDLIEIEKKQLIGEYKLYEKMSESEKQFYLRQQFKQSLKWTKQNMDNYISIIEKCLLMLWRHVEFFLVNFESNVQSFQLYKNDFYSLENLKDMTTPRHMLKSDISRDEFVKFKQDLTACLNPTFIKRLLDLEQKLESLQKDSFVNVLVKRIQRLIHLHNN